ncbi:hypothetical protein D9757_000041 [Collybiopsis confluens]|uniref:Uncharacterized protein n=1 Tax=Collybiopsis confluens TaxID=2823264 RepID=A0A8H5I1Z9_9AGAR|nr:hypothetical protein D9757_000041 [Collybiopsis confluens]
MSSGMPQSRPASPDVDGAIFQLQHEFASHEMAVIERSDRILPSSASVPHGKFTATTATFCWPSLKPFSQLNEPNMYRIQSTPSFLATPWPPLSSDTSPALSSRSTTSSASKQSHSEYDHDVDDNNFVSENMSPEELPIVRTRKELFDDQNAPDMGRTATAYSPSEKEAAHERSPPSQTHPSLSRSESVALRHASSNFRPEPQSSGSSEGEYMDWEIYTRHVERDYFCTWGGCNYQAKKQLVKRHIQTTHMKLKYATYLHPLITPINNPTSDPFLVGIAVGGSLRYVGWSRNRTNRIDSDDAENLIERSRRI